MTTDMTTDMTTGTTGPQRHRTSPPSWLVEVAREAGLEVPAAVTRLQGRNENQLTHPATAGGDSFLVKRLVGPGATDRFARSLGHARLVQHGDSAGSGAPELVHADHGRGVLVHRAVPGATSGNRLLVEERFTPALCAQVGHTVGRLHAIDPAGLPAEGLPRRGPTLPTERALRALPLGAVHLMTAGEVDAWRILQSDDSLAAAVRRLRGSSAAAPRTWTHGDLRIDQVLVADDRTAVVDWEEFGLGDPAFDTGSWVGEWVYRAVLDIPTARGDGIGAEEHDGVLRHRSLTPEEIVRRGVAKLDALAPQVTAFWTAYRAEAPVDADLAARTAAYAGWHLLDRLLALAHGKAVLPGVPRAAAGVGKRLLANPAGAAEALGLHHDAAGPEVAA
ncbi:class V lanthionine synthetase subunit LxmK [Nocardioides litoris]|uniref:class V lanthionine synthetase subunit LxmK n=1 Tax=Nocardioides litoris TaxID=1926648 RepID=UPI001476FBAD|nr:class V lanthionine synthetase subunit LxmK [Nocardioides litoris]